MTRTISVLNDSGKAQSIMDAVRSSKSIILWTTTAGLYCHIVLTSYDDFGIMIIDRVMDHVTRNWDKSTYVL